MIKRFSLLLAVMVTLTAVVSVAASPARQITLKNGMVVILKENHSTPMVSSIVCVRAGSIYENASNNGYTHFLEHLLFDGTENMSRIELNEGIKDHGGYINAFTQKDLTGYLFVIPSMFAEYAVNAQDQQLFHSTLPESELPKERKVVIEEIKMNDDNPETRAEVYFDSLIYQGTPYARTVLGPIDVIESITRDEVMAYYKERYVPNNMIALFIGDFKSEDFIKIVDKYFGGEPEGKLPKQESFSINPPYGKTIHYFEYPSDVTRIHIVFPAPRYDQEGYYAADVMAQIIDSGESSPLYQKLTAGDDPLVNEMSFYLESNRDFSLLHFAATTESPEKIKDIVGITAGFLESLRDLPFDKKQLKRIVIKNKTDKIYLEEKLHYYGILQAPMLVNFGYDYIRDYVDNLSKVEPDDIQKLAREYLNDSRYLAMAAIPKKAEEEQ
jgi:zinc protease